MFHQQNNTPYPATAVILPDVSGTDCLVSIVKASFSLELRPKIVHHPLDWQPAERHYGDANATSLQYPPDYTLLKPATDIIVQGLALTPDEVPMQSMDVSVRVGDVHKRLTVLGDRYWQGEQISAAEPYVNMPMVYERAFGGRVLDDEGTLLAINEYNPVGMGMAASYVGAAVTGDIPLPNLEDPEHRIQNRSERPLPAAFGAVPAHWEPRLSLSGTYDQDWLRTRAPWLPEDFNPFWLNCASRGLICSSHLKGGEPIVVSGMHPQGEIRAVLPEISLQATVNMGRTRHACPLHIDTVLLEPNELRLTLTLRGQFPLGRKIMQVDSVAFESTRSTAGCTIQALTA